MWQWLLSRLRKKPAPRAGTQVPRYQLDATARGSLLAALRTIAGHLEELVGLEATIEAEARIRATLDLDQQAAPYLAQAWDQLFPPASRGNLPDDIWLSLSNFYRLSAAAYDIALKRFPATNGSASGKRFAELSRRAIQRRHSHEKLQRFRYRSAAPSLWTSYAALYADACRHGVQALPLRDGAAETDGTVQSALLQALMFEVAPLGNLSPEQIECLDELLGRDCDLLVLRSAPDDRSPFVFGANAPHRHVHGRAEPAAAGGEPLCFGPGLAYGNVLRRLASLEAGQPAPWLAQLPGSVEEKIGLLRLLRDTWSNTPPTRRSPRQEEEGDLNVVHGFARVRRMVVATTFALAGGPGGDYASYRAKARDLDDYLDDAAQATESADSEPLSPLHVLQKLEQADGTPLEQWSLANSSERGLGLVVPPQKRGLKIGALIGYRQQESLQWDIAVIRRLGRTPHSGRVAGLQLLPGQPLPVNLRYLKKEEILRPGQEAVADFHDGILLSRHDRTLILEAGNHKPGQRMLLLAMGLRRTVVLEEVLESREDFCLVRYRDESPA
ncbi:hypothetical protein DLREEDagrD3_03830 [Denitratisoma sp. agr-D3]